jgi:hypothetical protein
MQLGGLAPGHHAETARPTEMLLCETLTDDQWEQFDRLVSLPTAGRHAPKQSCLFSTGVKPAHACICAAVWPGVKAVSDDQRWPLPLYSCVKPVHFPDIM